MQFEIHIETPARNRKQKQPVGYRHVRTPTQSDDAAEDASTPHRCHFLHPQDPTAAAITPPNANHINHGNLNPQRQQATTDPKSHGGQNNHTRRSEEPDQTTKQIPNIS
jgi:hypothetical protein